MFKQYDTVRITKLRETPAVDTLGISRRLPKVGDVAAIVEVYETPSLGYELECTSAGQTEWLHSFRAEDIDLELVARPDPPSCPPSSQGSDG